VNGFVERAVAPVEDTVVVDVDAALVPVVVDDSVVVGSVETVGGVVCDVVVVPVVDEVEVPVVGGGRVTLVDVSKTRTAKSVILKRLSFVNTQIRFQSFR